MWNFEFTLKEHPCALASLGGSRSSDPAAVVYGGLFLETMSVKITINLGSISLKLKLVLNPSWAGIGTSKNTCEGGDERYLIV